MRSLHWISAKSLMSMQGSHHQDPPTNWFLSKNVYKQTFITILTLNWHPISTDSKHVNFMDKIACSIVERNGLALDHLTSQNIKQSLIHWGI